MKYSLHLFGPHLVESDAPAKETAGRRTRLLWLKVLLLKRLPSGKTEEEIIEKQKALIDVLEDLKASLGPDEEIFLANCVSNKFIRLAIISNMHQEIQSRQRMLQARTHLDKGEYQAVADDLALLARDDSIAETVAVKKSEVFELLTIRRAALKQLEYPDVEEQLLSILAQIKLINNDLELLTVRFAQDAVRFLNDLVHSGDGAFALPESSTLVQTARLQAQQICLELVNSLCSLFASDEDVVKVSLLGALSVCLLQLESPSDGWPEVLNFVNLLHDFIAARKACTCARGIFLRVATDFYFDLHNKMERTLEIDREVSLAREKAVRDGTSTEEAEQANPFPPMTLRVDLCSTEAAMELEFLRRQCLCCLFDVELLEAGSDVSLIRSHVVPTIAGATPSAIAAAPNSKDPANLLRDQPQHLSTSATPAKRNFVRVIGAKSLETDAGREIASWALRHLQSPLADVLRPRGKKISAAAAATTLWRFINMILTGSMKADLAKRSLKLVSPFRIVLTHDSTLVEIPRRANMVEQYLNHESDQLPQKQQVSGMPPFPFSSCFHRSFYFVAWYDSIFYTHGKLDAVVKGQQAQLQQADSSIENFLKQLWVNPSHHESWEELHKFFSTKHRHFLTHNEKSMFPVNDAGLVEWKQFSSTATRLGLRAVRSIEWIVSAGLPDCTHLFSLGIQYFYLAKTLESGTLSIPVEKRDSRILSQVIRFFAKSCDYFIRATEDPAAKWFMFYMAGKTSESLLRKVGQLVRFLSRVDFWHCLTFLCVEPIEKYCFRASLLSRSLWRLCLYCFGHFAVF